MSKSKGIIFILKKFIAICILNNIKKIKSNIFH